MGNKMKIFLVSAAVVGVAMVSVIIFLLASKPTVNDADIFQQAVGYILLDEFGDTGDKERPRIIGMIDEDTYAINASERDELSEFMLLDKLKGVYSRLPEQYTRFQHNRDVTFVFYAPTIDAYGNKNNSPIMRITMSLDNMSKANWSEMIVKNVAAIASEYESHSEIKDLR